MMYLLPSSKNHMLTPKPTNTHSRTTIGQVITPITPIPVLRSYGSTNWTLRSIVFNLHCPLPYTIGPLQSISDFHLPLALLPSPTIDLLPTQNLWSTNNLLSSNNISNNYSLNMDLIHISLLMAILI